MKSFVGHIAAGVTGSTVAAVVLESGSLIASASLIGVCICFVGLQIKAQGGSRV